MKFGIWELWKGKFSKSAKFGNKFFDLVLGSLEHIWFVLKKILQFWIYRDDIINRDFFFVKRRNRRFWSESENSEYPGNIIIAKKFRPRSPVVRKTRRRNSQNDALWENPKTRRTFPLLVFGRFFNKVSFWGFPRRK